METFEWYKDFGIRYEEITGTTHVEDFGVSIKSFVGFGSVRGEKAAKEFIDRLGSNKGDRDDNRTRHFNSNQRPLAGRNHA